MSRPLQSPALPPPVWALLCCAALQVSCSWSRFDDLRDQTPVVQIEAPSGIVAFGARMQSLRQGKGSLLLVGGDASASSSLAAFAVADDRPSTAPIDEGYCGAPCVSDDRLTPLASAATSRGAVPTCFLLGTGERDGNRGLVGRCADQSDFIYAVPADDPAHPERVSPHELVDALLEGAQPDAPIRHAASRDDLPLVVAAAPTIRQAWFYAPGSDSPVTLEPPSLAANDPSEDFGAALAVASLLDGDRLVAISAPRTGQPNQNGHIYFYRIDHSTSAVTPWGCLSGQRSGFGLHLFAGPVSGDANDELLVADADSITVYDAGALAQQPLPDACGAPLLSSDAYVATLTCAGDVQGCDGVPFAFGSAVALGDLDGDGANEVIVGMGDLGVDGNGRAGAVLVYRVDRDPSRTSIVETLRLASPSAGDGLGASVATVRVGARDVVVAGAPGASSIFLFYCSSLGAAGRDSFRCP